LILVSSHTQGILTTWPTLKPSTIGVDLMIG